MIKNIVQVYAVIICIVAIISFLIAIANLTSTAMDAMDPLNSSRTEVSLSSFEYFKMDLLKTTTKEQYYIPSDEEIQNMYGQAKSQHLMRIQHNTTRSFAVNSIVIALSVIFFFTHWRMVSKKVQEG